MKKNFERLEFLISKLGRGLPFREADCYRYSVFYIFLLQCNIPRPTYPKDSPIKNVQIKNGKKTNGPSLPKPSMGNKRLTQVKSESNMEDCTPLRLVHNLFFLFPNRERYLNLFFRNYKPETPVDDYKKDPSFDLKKEQRRTRVAPKRSLDHTVNTSASDDTVSSSPALVHL